MKNIYKLIISILMVAAVPTIASAHHKPLPAGYKLPASYQAIYCYPSGSYWQTMFNAYPTYDFSSYATKMGAGTIYCP